MFYCISSGAGTLEALVLSAEKLATAGISILFASVGQCSTLRHLSINDHWNNRRVGIPQQNLIYLLTNCPLLESLTLELCLSDNDTLTPSQPEVIEYKVFCISHRFFYCIDERMPCLNNCWQRCVQRRS
jgi:hypothetical protein